MTKKSKRFKNSEECSKLKSKVRNSKEWALLKKVVFKRQEGKDPITGSKLSPHAHLHHLNLNNDFYDDLNPDNFLLLNKKSHDFIHFYYDYFDYLCINHIRILNYVTKMRTLTNVEWSKENGRDDKNI